MSQQEINVFIKLKDQLTAGLNKMSGTVERFGSKMKGFGDSMTKNFTVPLGLAGGAAIKLASDAEETRSKFDTIFKDMTSGANEMADDFAKSFGLAGTTARGLLGDTGDLLTGLGFTQDAALDLSEEVNSLAVDLASFSNYAGGAEGASKALTSGLLGEREAMKGLGIVISQNAVDMKVMENAMQGLTFESELQANAFATLQLAQEQSLNAIGDYGRTSDSAANQMRLLKESTKELGENIGVHLLPHFVKIVNKLNDWIVKFSNLDQETQKIIVTVGLVVAAIGPLALLISGVTTAIGALSAAFTFLAANPIVLVIAAIAALVAGLMWLWENSDQVNQWISEGLQALSDFFVTVWNGIKAFVEEIWTAISEFLMETWDAIYDVAETVWTAISEFFTMIWDGMMLVVTTAIDGIKSYLSFGFNIVKGVFTTIWNGISSFFSGVWEGMKGVVTSAMDAIKNIFTASYDAVTGAFGAIWTGASDLAIGAFETVKNAAKAMVNWVIKKINFLIRSLNSVTGVINGIPGVDIGQVGEIPLLAEGGIVTRPTLAMVGEGGEPEAVIPLSKLGNYGGGTGGGITVNVTGNTLLDESAGEQIGNMIARELKLSTQY